MSLFVFEKYKRGGKRDVKYTKKADSIEINNILESLADWKRDDKVSRFGAYGVQRGFTKI